MKKSICLLILTVLFHSNSHAQAFEDTIQKIDKLFTGWNDSTPGGTLNIQRNGTVLYNKSFGLADLEHGVRNFTETVYEAGSVSKQFTATALFLLINEGKLSLNDDVRKYIPELPVYDHPIKVYHLVHHISGLKDWGSVAAIGGWPRGTRAYQPAHVLEIISRQKSLNFPPGERYSYSNSNYNLMATLVERISNKTLADFTRERIFEPMGMMSTQWRDDFTEIVRNRAIAYGKNGKVYFSNMPFENTHGHGGLLTTVSDLLKWNTYWKTGRIDTSQIAEMQQKTGVLNNGTSIFYAGGVGILQRNGVREISHSGATAAYRSWLAYYPEKDLSIVFLSNDGSVNPETIGGSLATIFFGATQATSQNHVFEKIDTNELKRKTGVYRNRNGFDVADIQFRDTAIVLKNGPVLKAFSRDSFLLGSNSRMIFNGDELKVRTGNTINYYQKMEVPVLSDKSMEEFTGSYDSEEADAKVRIELKDGKLQLFRLPDIYIPLTYSFRDAFYTPNNGMLVEFVRTKKKVTGFLISIGRAEKVLFMKK